MNKYIYDFLNKLEFERNYSLDTVTSYKNSLLDFEKFAIENKMNIINIDYQFIRLYLNHMYNLNYANKTMAQHISTLRSFYKYLRSLNIIESNPMTLVSNPKIEKKLPNFLYYKELEQLLDTPDTKTTLGLRDALILEMLYSTGVRVSELVNIKLSSINHSTLEITIVGKGNKTRIVMYGKRCANLLNEYLKRSRPELEKETNEYLILGNRGNKINVREVRMIVTSVATKSGLKQHISPHTLRHTFATHMLDGGANLRSVQQLLGHESLSTTTIYTHVTNEHLRQVYLSAHPRAHKK